MNKLKIIDRIEAGGLKSDLGQFFDLGNAGANLSSIVVQRQVLDNAGFGIQTSDYYTNFNNNTTIEYTTSRGLVILDTLKKSYLIARAPTTFAVPSGGYPSLATNAVQFDTVITDPSGSHDVTTMTYTCRSYGVYRVAARIVLAVPIGTRVRIAVIKNGSIVEAARFFYATTTNAQCYDIDVEGVFSAGGTINIVADQNTGSAIGLTSMGTSNENSLFITQI